MGAAARPVGTLRSEVRALERAYSPGHHGVWAARRRAGSWTQRSERCSHARAHQPVRRSRPWGYGRGLLLPGPTSTCSSSTTVPIRTRWHSSPTLCCIRFGTRVSTWVMRSARPRVGGRRPLGRGRRDDGHPLPRGRQEPRGGRRREDRAMGSAGPARSRGPSGTTQPAAPSGSGSTAHLLEPDLKEVPAVGATSTRCGCSSRRSGSHWRRRDCSATASAKRSRPRRSSSSACGRAAPRDREAGERLVLDRQPSIARAMGFEDEPRLIAIDGLMRALFEHARDVEFVFRAVTERLREAGAAPIARPRPLPPCWRLSPPRRRPMEAVGGPAGCDRRPWHP